MGKIIDRDEGELQIEQRKGEIREKAKRNGREFERELMRGKAEFNYHSKTSIL